MEDEYDEFVGEAPEYSPKSEFSKAQIVQKAMEKCIELRNQEMKPGYYNVKLDKSGFPQKIWIPDARERFIGSVIVLRNLLSPEISRDKTFQDKEKKYKKEMDELFEHYAYEEYSLIEQKDETGNFINKYKKTGYIIMPEMDDKIVLQVLKFGKYEGKESIGGWNKKVNCYRSELVYIYDEYFALLNNLIDKLNYFKVKSSF